MQVGPIENIEVGTEVNIARPKTIYHFRDVTDKVKINGNVDYKKVGEYNVIYTLDTLLGKYEKQEKIKVVDTVAPEIVLEGEREYRQSYAKDFIEPGFKAIDAYEGELTNKVSISKQEIDETRYDIKYEVQDTSGNIAKKVRHVTIVDDIAPEITPIIIPSTINGHLIKLFVAPTYFIIEISLLLA